MTRMLLIDDVDGGPQTWGIPARLVEEHWAKTIIERGQADGDTLEELLSPNGLPDDPDLLYWAAQEMTWDDIKQHIVVIEDSPPPIFFQEWKHHNMRIGEPSLVYRTEIQTAHWSHWD